MPLEKPSPPPRDPRFQDHEMDGLHGTVRQTKDAAQWLIRPLFTSRSVVQTALMFGYVFTTFSTIRL